MSDFFDTNILIYAKDPRDPRKQQVARELSLRVELGREAWVSSQVLQEFASAMLVKLKLQPAHASEEIRLLVKLFRVWPVESATVLRGLALHARYGVNFWDGLILAAAEAAGCERVLSEDLNAGQRYGSVRVENPFG